MDHQKAKNINILLLSFGFMLVYIYSWIIPIRTLIIDSAKNESSVGYVDGFNGDGSFSISICNVVLAIANFFAPPILSKIGPRLTLILGGICYSFFIAQMVYPNDYMLYGASAVAGLGIALSRVAQGNLLVLNSDTNTKERNTGIFFAMYTCSKLIGNTYIYFQFQGFEDIDKSTRTTVSDIFY